MRGLKAPLIAALFCLVSSTLWAGASTISTDVSTSTIRGQSLVSTLNSTTATLTAGATYFGTFEETVQCSGISVMVYANAASITRGMKIEWSADGTTVLDDDTFSISSGTTKQFTFGTPARFYRIHYINGSVAQSSFTIQTILHGFDYKSSSQRLADDLNDNDDAELVKAVVAAKDDTSGSYTNLTTKDGRLKVEARSNQSDNLYAANASSVTAATADTDNPILLLTNSSSSTKTAKLLIRIYGVETTNVVASFDCFLNPVITSSGTPTPVIGVGAAVSTATFVSAYTLPTVSSLGGQIDTVPISQNNSPAIVNDNFLVWIKPGSRLLLTANPNSNNRSVFISVKWVEE